MGRFPQKPGQKGSQKWIQHLLNERQDLLNDEIIRQAGLPKRTTIEWRSPLANDDYAEYRDRDFLELLEISLSQHPLEDFWPARGPQWDALGKSEDGTVFLVEAKSHIPELLSRLGAKSSESTDRILASLQEAKKHLNSKLETDWSSPFYQYTNRIAHLYLFRVLNEVPAYLIFVYFLNDEGMKGPRTADEWKGALKLLHAYLGIGRNRLSKFIIDVFIHINDLQK